MFSIYTWICHHILNYIHNRQSSKVLLTGNQAELTYLWNFPKRKKKHSKIRDSREMWTLMFRSLVLKTNRKHNAWLTNCFPSSKWQNFLFILQAHRIVRLPPNTQVFVTFRSHTIVDMSVINTVKMNSCQMCTSAFYDIFFVYLLLLSFTGSHLCSSNRFLLLLPKLLYNDDKSFHQMPMLVWNLFLLLQVSILT